MTNYIGQEQTFFIVGNGPRFGGSEIETFPVSISGVSCLPVSDVKSATWFTDESRAKSIVTLINQMAVIMSTNTNYELRKQTLTLEKVD